MRFPLLALLSAASFISAAGVALAAIDGPVGRDAENGDPARWFEPADTPRKQYDNAMKEAAAALAEALRECKAAPDRRECEARAREQNETDVERARGFLVRSTFG
ncbi:MAG TPA: hypothetical protein VEC19_20435 [Usitatibacter sp.]|nr:hypothetical protein [Usitatibacter sp.]